MSCDSRRSESFYLPQYGFGTETEFKKLVEQNPFLYRVHSPKSSNHPDVPRPQIRRTIYIRRIVDAPAPTYSDVARHMDGPSGRPHGGTTLDVEIAVIDASDSIPARSITVVEILRSVPPAERHENHWKWFHFAQASQLTLVYGGIPQTAVLTSVPIFHIVDKLPSYCLGPIAPPTPAPSASGGATGARLRTNISLPPHNSLPVLDVVAQMRRPVTRNVKSAHDRSERH
ncbi:hypothetical protein C8R47DRAFT_1229052 [Mycena vitilis]|nr:hypothetical protein C8R47DRAFT_1229052 [Mycena vitilis]